MGLCVFSWTHTPPKSTCMGFSPRSGYGFCPSRAQGRAGHPEFSVFGKARYPKLDTQPFFLSHTCVVYWYYGRGWGVVLLCCCCRLWYGLAFPQRTFVWALARVLGMSFWPRTVSGLMPMPATFTARIYACLKVSVYLLFISLRARKEITHVVHA